MSDVPRPSSGVEGQRHRRRNWAHATGERPGVSEGDMPRQNCRRKPGTTRGSPRRVRTAKTSRISRSAVKSGCACEWDGWGRISEDGPGQHNPARSEGPWGRAVDAARMAALVRATPPAQNGDCAFASGEHDGWMQTRRRDTWTPRGKALLDMPALKPYWGKPAVRNFRGDDGDVGIIREQPTRLRILRGESPRSANCL